MNRLMRVGFAAVARWRLPARALVLIAAVTSLAEAQASPVAPGDSASPPTWRFSGEVGGVLGGQWLSGADAPRVSTDPGLALSVGAHWQATRRVSTGLSARGTMQPISMEEAGATWSGGTATDAQLLGTVAFALRSTGHIVSDGELGGGIAFLTGTREVFPFTAVSRFAPVAEAGLVLALGGVRESLRRYKPFAVVVRYAVLRIDADGGTATLPSSMTTNPGWVGRTTIALRYRQ